MVVDFGKFGKRVSYGRFTRHPPADAQDRLVLGVLNFEPRQMGPVVSEVLILGVQDPKAQGGEATFVSPVVDAKCPSINDRLALHGAPLGVKAAQPRRIGLR
jgi:tRNA-binding protein